MPRLWFMVSKVAMSLKAEYENLLRSIIDTLPINPVNSLSIYMQGLKHFFTHLCNQGVPPDRLTEADVEDYFLYKYSTGTAVTTLTSYYGTVNRFYLAGRSRN